MKPDRRPLRVRDERPRSDGVVDKCNDPPPHGVAPAEDSTGYKKNITFREFYRSLRQAGPRSATETTAICRKYLCTPLYGSRRIEGGTIYASIAMAMIATRTSGQRTEQVMRLASVAGCQPAEPIVLAIALMPVFVL